MSAIIISDLHIGSRYFQPQILESFLAELPSDHELILNGDVIDRPCVKLLPSHQRILCMIERISLRQKVVWIRGNHDNGHMPGSIGKVDFSRHHTIGNRLLIAHGDDFDDIMPRSRLFIMAFNLLHEIRVRLGARPVHVAEYAKKWKYLYSLLRKNVMLNAVACAAANGFEAVTCGHTHYAEDSFCGGIRYVNTGAWTELPAFCLRVNAADMRLDKIDHSGRFQKVKFPAPIVSSPV